MFYVFFDWACKIFTLLARFCAPFVILSPLVVLWDAAVWLIGGGSAFETDVIPVRLALYAVATILLLVFAYGARGLLFKPWLDLYYTAHIGDKFTLREITRFNRFADPIRQGSLLFLGVWFLAFYLVVHPVIIWHSAGLLYTEHKSCVRAVVGPNVKAVRTSVFFLHDKSGDRVVVSKASGGLHDNGLYSEYGTCTGGKGGAFIRGPYFKASASNFAPHPYRDVTALLGYPKNIPQSKFVGGDAPPLPKGINE